jgi:hypothetical protein
MSLFSSLLCAKGIHRIIIFSSCKDVSYFCTHFPTPTMAFRSWEKHSVGMENVFMQLWHLPEGVLNKLREFQKHCIQIIYFILLFQQENATLEQIFFLQFSETCR